MRKAGLKLEVQRSKFEGRADAADEVGANAVCLNDVVGDGLIGKPEVPLRFLEGRVEDRVFDDDLVRSAVSLRA